jgi:hypothetical protein
MYVDRPDLKMKDKISKQWTIMVGGFQEARQLALKKFEKVPKQFVRSHSFLLQDGTVTTRATIPQKSYKASKELIPIQVCILCTKVKTANSK